MMRGLIRFAIFAVVVFVLFWIAVTFLTLALRVMLPIAILALAAYGLYVLVSGKRTQ